jgi:oxygen-independent coproporphyrinogen-3 oxidase
MPRLYIHIPYCKQACHYCDFHFSTTMDTRARLVPALVDELRLRADELTGTVDSVYFGGGTPSLLSAQELELLFLGMDELLTRHPEAEVTLEANPDDLSAEKLALWKSVGVNRLSIGIQSFHEDDLRWMNRAHTADEALRAVDRARTAGFERLTLDLIYGLPHWTNNRWEANLRELFALEPDHFSAYILTVEPKTALGKRVAQGKQPVADDNQIEREYALLCAMAADAGYRHYEVSNFAQPGKRAAHNSAYWEGETYVGIGPGAHSFDGQHRRWNIASNTAYLRHMSAGTPFWEGETLTPTDRHNERLLTGLRTARGIDLTSFTECGSPAEHLETAAIWRRLVDSGDIIATADDRFRIPESRWLMADGVAGELFVV